MKEQSNRFEQYRILRKLGSGQHGVISLGSKRTRAKELVAIKEVSEQFRTQYNAQFQVLPRLTHPNIIQFLKEIDEGVIVLEYASNGDLHTFAKQKYSTLIPQEELVKWLCQICLALYYLHYEKRILHRDIKARNILVMGNGLLKLGDFGIARQLEKHEQFAKTAVGTPFYLSPQALQLSKYNSTSDVWGLGCVMFQLCTGNKPFEGSSLNDLFKQILNEEVGEIPQTYSEWFCILIKSMLEKNPDKRITVEGILECKQIRQAFLDLKQEYLQYEDLPYPIIDIKTKKHRDRQQISRLSFNTESLKTVKNEKSIKMEIGDWKKSTIKKESRKVEFDKFKNRSLKSIIEMRISGRNNN